jgi:serine/threonine protein kinase
VDSASWQQAKHLLMEALERPVEERTPFVRERCANSAVCAEILEMLEDVRTRDEFLASRHLQPGLGGDADPLELGTKVGPYIVVDRLGMGGMGQVFLGTDPRLERRVALKCLLDSYATGSSVRSSILHEARAAARISSQHVAAVYDVIEHGTRAFIVMEYVDGESLAARLKRGRLTVEETLTYGRQLVLALSAAHAEDIVHRDLKPGNIQLTRAGSLKVLDFGIAHATRRLPTAVPTTSAPTDIGQAVQLAQPGTPPYMSLEQLFGRHVDGRSDIYSLGVVLFEMCTGRRPYTGTDAAQLAAAQIKGVPRADGVSPDIPRPLADLIARAMATDASKRYQTVEEVGLALDDVERLIERQSRPGGREIIRRWMPRIVVAVPTTIAALGVLGFLTSMQFNFVFGKDGEFSRFGAEPWINYFFSGVRFAIPSLVLMTLAAALVVGVSFVVRLLMLAGPIGRLGRRIGAQGARIEQALGLDTSATRAQALVGLGIATLALFIWSHAGLMRAWMSFFNSSPIAQLMPMTDSAPERNQFHNQLSVATLAFSFGLYKVMAMRAREKLRDGRAAVVMLGVLVGVMVVLNALPWRTLNRRDFPRIDSAGAHCYITGESGDEFLVLCPGSEPPRNRVVRKEDIVDKVDTDSDPRWHRPGGSENVFKGVPFGFRH